MSKRLRTRVSASFDDVWLSGKRFKLWIKKANNKCEAILVRFAMIKLLILKQWVYVQSYHVVISHGEGDKHKRKLKNYTSMSSLMLENSSSSNSKKESSSSHNSSARVDVMVNKVNVSQAEI